MNEKREGEMLMMAALVWAAFVLFSVLCCSCSSKKVLTETLYVHDTVYTSHADTVREVRIETKTVTDTMLIHVKDTIIHEHGQVIVLNENGDTIKQREWDNLMEKMHELINAHHNETSSEIDSTLIHENDSLRHALKEEREKQKVVIKENPLKDLYQFSAFVAVFGIALFLLTRTRIEDKGK